MLPNAAPLRWVGWRGGAVLMDFDDLKNAQSGLGTAAVVRLPTAATLSALEAHRA